MNVKRIPVSLLTLFLATSLSVPAFAAKSAKEFSDWDGEAWYAEAMEWCVARGVFLGTPENTLEAQRIITRAEFTAILVRYFGCQETGGLVSFEDISESDWFCESVAAGYAAGIARGISDTLFAPRESVTREQAVTMLARGRNIEASAEDLLSTFTDAANVSGWAKDGMSAAVEAGLVIGYEDGTLLPKAPVTRAEAAELLYRVDRMDEKETASDPVSPGKSYGGGGSGGGGISGGGGTSGGKTNGDGTGGGENNGGNAGPSEEQQQQILNAAAKAGEFRVFADTELYAFSGMREVSCQIRCSEMNPGATRVTLCLADGTELGAVLLAPGESAEEMPLSSGPPSPGAHEARLIVTPERYGGAFEIEVTLHVT